MHASTHEWGRVAVGDDGFSRAQANALLSAARAHAIGGAEGTDILSDHHDHLTARQAVGVIAGRGCSLEILPKIDPADPDEADATVRGRLIHMLDVAFALDLSTGDATEMAHRADSLLDLFIALFADRLLAEARHGLPRLYCEEQGDLRAVRGRMDVVRQFTVHAVRPDRLACSFDTLSADTPLIRIMKACVLLLSRHARRTETQRKLAELRFLLADVADVAPGAISWKDVRIDRTSRRWQALLRLAQLLLGRRWQQTHVRAGDPHGVTLLFAMNDLFEAYVAAQLRRATASLGLEVVAQGGLGNCLGRWDPDTICAGDVFRTRPDLILRKDGRVLAIIDTKWKRPPVDPLDRKHGVSQQDVYQLMAYSRVYDCDRLMLLYPAGHGRAGGILHRFGITKGRERLEIGTIAVSTESEGILRQLRDIVEAMTS